MSGGPTGPLGVITFLLLFSYSCYCGPTFPKLSTELLIFIEILILLICEFGPLSDFVSRKVCHSASGLMMLHLDPRDSLARYFVYMVAASSLVMVWEVLELVTGYGFRFRYSRPRDVGISVYLIIVVVFFAWQVPLEIIKPVFFADPLGALVGRGLTEAGWPNPRWAGQKTVGGSLAVFLATLTTLVYGGWSERVVLAGMVTVAEGITREYDNLFIAGIVILGHVVLG